MAQKLTETDIAKIKAEIEDRKLNRRPKLIAAVKEARAQGDLSENFEYYAAKREKNQNESRIGYLERMLKSATVVTDESGDDEIGINDTVTIFHSGMQKEITYKIATPIRSDITAGRISIESPIGKALLGHKEGDEIEVSPQAGVTMTMKVLRIDKSSDEDEEINAF